MRYIVLFALCACAGAGSTPSTAQEPPQITPLAVVDDATVVCDDDFRQSGVVATIYAAGIVVIEAPDGEYRVETHPCSVVQDVATQETE